MNEFVFAHLAQLGKSIFMMTKAIISRSLWCLLFLQITPALAFEFTSDFVQGFYWQRFPISIAVSESDPVKKAELERLLDDAIEDWERYSNIDLWNRVDSSSNVLRWSDRFEADTNYDQDTTLAVTFRHITGPYVRKTEVILNASHHINSYNKHLRTVIVHELGHTIGLDHSFTSGAVMEAGVDLYYDGLHADDIEGLGEVSNQAITRQDTNYVSPLSYDNSVTYGPSCGTIDLNTGGGTGSGGPGGMIFSLLIGLLFALPRNVRKKAPIA